MGRSLILSCEHASNQVPPHLAAYFQNAHSALDSHRGWDFGALEICQKLAELWMCPRIFLGQYSRLVVDLNRSEHHPKVFSSWTSALSSAEKEQLMESLYRPFRKAVRDAVKVEIAKGNQVLHLSIHSFTPALDGEVRNNDLGILYDPKRTQEQALALQWEKRMKAHGDVRVRRNYPYRGVSDGHTSSLRKLFPKNYLGIEIEWNQAFLQGHSARSLAQLLAETLPAQ